MLMSSVLKPVTGAQANSESSLEELDFVHLLPSAWAGHDPPIPVESLARFTALRSLYLRRADQNSMRTTALPLPTGLRRALLLIFPLQGSSVAGPGEQSFDESVMAQEHTHAVSPSCCTLLNCGRPLRRPAELGASTVSRSHPAQPAVSFHARSDQFAEDVSASGVSSYRAGHVPLCGWLRACLSVRDALELCRAGTSC